MCVFVCAKMCDCVGLSHPSHLKIERFSDFHFSKIAIEMKTKCRKCDELYKL